jgi:plasmid stabilization system protein ParE
MRVEYHPQVASDLNSAIDHYNELRAGLGDVLRAEVYAAIDRIRLNPAQYREIEAGVRRCFVHRFPYSVLFRCPAADVIRVLVIRHHRRRPTFGLRRR